MPKISGFSKRMDKEGFKPELLKAKPPIWEGPQSAGKQGGVTSSLLSRYVACQERFRIKTIESLVPNDRFNKSIEYGTMWHICEEYYAAGQPWGAMLAGHVKNLSAKYRFDGDEILKWYNVCQAQFPHYVEYWKKHPDTIARKPLLQEYEFKVPYQLPSGRIVYLRGKMDSVDLVQDKKRSELWLQENKSKGDIAEEHIARQLTFDLQTMLYLEMLSKLVENPGPLKDKIGKAKLTGVRYNVIRRPLAGGRHSIRQKKPTKSNPQGQSLEEYYKELSDCIAGEPEYFFMRWDVHINEKDQFNFRGMFLHPILENLLDDFEWWSHCYEKGLDHFNYLLRNNTFNKHRLRTFRLPFGIYNPVAEGVIGDYDNYLANGDKVGLVRCKNLFPELHNG